jgi:putative membrane-bound dehydrogenase-like protein
LSDDEIDAHRLACKCRISFCRDESVDSHLCRAQGGEPRRTYRCSKPVINYQINGSDEKEHEKTRYLSPMDRVLVLVAVLIGLRAWSADQPVFQIPPGFKIELAAGPPQIKFPMFATLDDKGRLYVTESSGGDLYAELQKQVRTCRISVLEDRNSDGRFEIAHVFAENLAPSMGLAWRGGKLYAADPPDLVTLEDTDGDGHADKRTVVLTGFGHNDNGSLHGITFGPDGWLYFTMGNPDGYDLRGPDGSRTRSGTGALIRCLPNGSRVETVARGFENLVEIVFIPDGSIIGTLNWYQLPDRGVRDALVHILEAGQFPIHPVDNAPQLQFNAVLPPVALFPAVAHSGLESYRGDAFPPEMRGNLFSAEHNTRKIARHRLKPRGSSYAAENFDFVTTDDPDVHFSDVLEDADGSLLLVDTGSWYVQHCPTGRIRQAPARGAIYRVSYRRGSRPGKAQFSRDVSAFRTALRGTNAVEVAAAARMLGRLAETNVASELVILLHSPDPAVRLAAAEALAHCGNTDSVPAILTALAGDCDEFLDHALTFALHRLADSDALLSALDQPNPKVQRAALLLLDQPPFQVAREKTVVAHLNASDPRLRDTARWVLLRHPEWGKAGAAFLLQLIESSNSTEADRLALNQFFPLFQTNATVVSAIAGSLTNHKVPDVQRVRLLETLGTLELPGPPALLAEAIRKQLEEGSAAVRSPAIRASGALRIPGAEEALVHIAGDGAQPGMLRIEALRELVHRRPVLEGEPMKFLLSQLAVSNAAPARLAAAEALTSANLTPAQMVALLQTIRGDPLISPASILAVVERRGIHADYAVALLDYLTASLDAGWTISADQLTKLSSLSAIPDAQRARADTLLRRVTENIARQQDKLVEFELLLKGGDYVRGEKVFFEKAQCTTCHRVWENGGRVGPDLTNIGSIRSGSDILESLVLPSSTIAQGYETLNVTMKDGEIYTGVRIGKNDDPLLLRLASGTEMTLHLPQIERIDRSKLSLMPEGLLNTLTRDEVRDLLGYLQQLK